MRPALGAVAAILIIGGPASADEAVCDCAIAVARVTQAEALWHLACPVAEIDGLCETVARDTRPGPVCPTSAKVRTIVMRDARKVRDAMTALGQVIHDLDQRPVLDAAARHAYAVASLIVADRDFEAFARLEVPAKLDFITPAVRARSLARFAAWFEQETTTGAELTLSLERVFAMKDPAEITAAARIAQVHQQFFQALVTAPIPLDARSEDQRDAFCDKLAATAEPLEARAHDGFVACLAKSSELGAFTDASKLCERELSQLDPEHYPVSSELRRDPELVPPIVDVETTP